MEQFVEAWAALLQMHSRQALVCSRDWVALSSEALCGLPQADMLVAAVMVDCLVETGEPAQLPAGAAQGALTALHLCTCVSRAAHPSDLQRSIIQGQLPPGTPTPRLLQAPGSCRSQRSSPAQP